MIVVILNKDVSVSSNNYCCMVYDFDVKRTLKQLCWKNYEIRKDGLDGEVITLQDLSIDKVVDV